MINNIISYEYARMTGVLNEKNEVTYTIGIDGRKNSGKATFPFLGTVEATLANRCCFLWDVAVFTPEGIIARIERDGVVAEVVPGKGWELGKSACDGAAVIVEANTPFCCDPRNETYWSM
jgi:hypothetical protein